MCVLMGKFIGKKAIQHKDKTAQLILMTFDKEIRRENVTNGHRDFY